MPKETNYQGIFDLWFPDEGKYLYFVRERVISEQDAHYKANALAKREGRRVRVNIEDWSELRGVPRQTFATYETLDP